MNVTRHFDQRPLGGFGWGEGPANSGSALAVLRDTAHVGNIEAPDAFNRAVRDVLRGRRG